MNALISYFWPALAAGLVLGIVTGVVAFRLRRLRISAYVGGLVASILIALLWHGPLGAADRFSSEVERQVRATLVYYEIPQVSGHLHKDPLTRRIFLSGPADDFQRSELVRLIDDVPGVSGTSWSAGSAGVPLVAQGAAAAVAGFLLGLLLAYLIELRRRYNAQWNW